MRCHGDNANYIRRYILSSHDIYPVVKFIECITNVATRSKSGGCSIPEQIPILSTGRLSQFNAYQKNAYLYDWGQMRVHPWM